MDLLAFLQTTLINRLDYTLAYMAITILLFFYGTNIVKHVVGIFRGSKATRFLIFSVAALFGLNLLLLFLVNVILGITDSPVKWIVIAVLLVWAFFKFEWEMEKK